MQPHLLEVGLKRLRGESPLPDLLLLLLLLLLCPCHSLKSSDTTPKIDGECGQSCVRTD